MYNKNIKFYSTTVCRAVVAAGKQLGGRNSSCRIQSGDNDLRDSAFDSRDWKEWNAHTISHAADEKRVRFIRVNLSLCRFVQTTENISSFAKIPVSAPG